MENNYLTIDGHFENTLVIERSKFICNIKGVQNEVEAKEFVAEIKKAHSLATHNCYAYIADENGFNQKFSDDGEPQGTAGLPMLEVLKNKNIFKCVAVVTRYFGGIKLGKGGLTRAYSGSVVNCLDNAKIVKMQKCAFVELKFDYENYSNFLRFISEKEVKIVETEFLNDVRCLVAINLDGFEIFLKELENFLIGRVSFKKIKEDYVAF